MDAALIRNATTPAMMMMPLLLSSMSPNSPLLPSLNRNITLNLTNRTFGLFSPGINRPFPFPNSLLQFPALFWGFVVRPRPFGPPFMPPPPPPQPFPGPPRPPFIPPGPIPPFNPFPVFPPFFPPFIPPRPINPITEEPPGPPEPTPPFPTEIPIPETLPTAPPSIGPETPPTRYLFPNCGLTIPDLLSRTSGRNQVRIVGGRDTAIDLIPWQVSLQRPRNNQIKHYCGGTVIHPQYILTAAHCLDWYVTKSPK